MADDEYQEITLADLVSTIYRRKVVLISVFLVAVLLGVAVTAFATPIYEAQATVIPLEQADIIRNYLDSRLAAEEVAQAEGDALLSRIFPERWDAGTQTWATEPPTSTQAGLRIQGMVSVTGSKLQESTERMVEITTTSSDPALTRDVANALVRSLEKLRPTFENITVEEKFEVYYDGSNEMQARQRAEQIAQEKEYWLVLDTATTPSAPSSPNVTLNIALSVVLGLMMGVFAVFAIEWASNYRADRRAIEAPSRDEQYARKP